MTILKIQVPEYDVVLHDTKITNERIRNLYRKSEDQSWKTSDLCWDAAYDQSNPMNIDDSSLPIYNSTLWKSFTEDDKTQYRIHSQAVMLTNMIFTEHHGAVALGKIITMLPDYTTRLFMSTQLLDEFKHADILLRAFNDRFTVSYPIKPKTVSLIEPALNSNSWDRSYLAILMFEVFANLHYAKLSKTSSDTLFLQIFQKIQQDEARHIAYTTFLMSDNFNHIRQSDVIERESLILGLVENIEEFFGHYQIAERLGYDITLFNAAYAEHNKITKNTIITRLSIFLEGLNLYTPNLRTSFEKMKIT